MVIITAFQAEDPGSIPGVRSNKKVYMKYYYLASFNTEVNVVDPTKPTAKVGMEAFCYLGNECEYFEELMGAEDRLPVKSSQILSMMRIKQRMNPHRHIRIYSFSSTIESEELRYACENEPYATEMAIKEIATLL